MPRSSAAGVVGLTAARELQRRGFTVTIYAAALPPDPTVTSNWSLAGFTPTSGLSTAAARTPEWTTQFQQAVDIAYRRLQLLTGSRYGISWITNYSPTDDERMASGTNTLLPAHIQGAQVLLGSRRASVSDPGSPSSGRRCASSRPSTWRRCCTTSRVFGGQIVVRRFESPKEVAALPENVVVNCAGLGAKALFADPDLIPLKGQLTVLVAQPEIQYSTSGGARVQTAEPGLGIHMMPRADGIVLGGTSERDVWTYDVNEAERKRIVEGHIELFNCDAGAGGMSDRQSSMY